MSDLLDLLREQEHETDPRREWVHSTLPNMGYACGGNLVDGLPDGGPRGKWILGGWSETAVGYSLGWANDLISSSVSGSPHSAAFSNRSVSKTKAASFGAISTTRIVIA